MMVKTETLQNCDFIKLIMMLLVVLEHAIAVTNDNWFNLDIQRNDDLHLISWTLDQFHIFAFALISGYIFHYLQVERNHYPLFRDFVKKKAMRLLIPLLFVAIIWVLPMNSVFYGAGFNESLWLLIEGPSQLWFLYMLFGVYIIGWLLSDYIVKLGWLLLPVMAFVYFLGLGGLKYLINPFQIWRVFMFFPFFYLGFMIRREDCRNNYARPRLLIVGGV